MTTSTDDAITRMFPGEGTEIPDAGEIQRMNHILAHDPCLSDEDRQPIARTRPLPDSERHQANNRAYFRSQIRRWFCRAGYQL